MEIYPGIAIVGKALFVESTRTLCIADLHLGYESHAVSHGVLLPRFQFETLLMEIQEIITATSPQTIVINGDFKHRFGALSNQEWHDAYKLFHALKDHCQKIILVKGNHDVALAPLLRLCPITVVPEHFDDGILFIHGDALPKHPASVIVIGHEHPALTLVHHGAAETYKCHLKGSWKTIPLVVQASFNPLVEGTNLLAATPQSPLLTDLDKFEAWIIEKKHCLYFGTIEHIRATLDTQDTQDR